MNLLIVTSTGERFFVTEEKFYTMMEDMHGVPPADWQVMQVDNLGLGQTLLDVSVMWRRHKMRKAINGQQTN